jgi:hypothetical protein
MKRELKPTLCLCLTRTRQKPVRIHVMGAGEWRENDDIAPPARHTSYRLHGGAGWRQTRQQRRRPAAVIATTPLTRPRGWAARFSPFRALVLRIVAPWKPILTCCAALCRRWREMPRSSIRCDWSSWPRQVHLALISLPGCATLPPMGAPPTSATAVCDGLFRVEPDRGEARWQPFGGLRTLPAGNDWHVGHGPSFPAGPPAAPAGIQRRPSLLEPQPGYGRGARHRRQHGRGRADRSRR